MSICVALFDAANHASKDGLGACLLLQENKPVLHASSSLSKVEQIYAQIEKELTAIVFACKRFHHMI